MLARNVKSHHIFNERIQKETRGKLLTELYDTNNITTGIKIAINNETFRNTMQNG